MDIQITNQELFSKLVDVEINLQKYQTHFKGDVVLITERGEACYTGEHGSKDYEEDYGFIII